MSKTARAVVMAAWGLAALCVWLVVLVPLTAYRELRRVIGGGES